VAYAVTPTGVDIVSTRHAKCVRHLPQATLCIFDYSNILFNMIGALRQFKSEIFQALANPTRIAIVEALREGEMSAGQLIEKLGIEQANASQHLSILRARQIVVNRKVGNQVFYSIRDPALLEVLDILRRYFYSQLSQTVTMLDEVGQAGAK
jgi:DNA-binding transcriptional ArsR family regulator